MKQTLVNEIIFGAFVAEVSLDSDTYQCQHLCFGFRTASMRMMWFLNSRSYLKPFDRGNFGTEVVTILDNVSRMQGICRELGLCSIDM